MQPFEPAFELVLRRQNYMFKVGTHNIQTRHYSCIALGIHYFLLFTVIADPTLDPAEDTGPAAVAPCACSSVLHIRIRTGYCRVLSNLRC